MNIYIINTMTRKYTLNPQHLLYMVDLSTELSWCCWFCHVRLRTKEQIQKKKTFIRQEQNKTC